MMTTSGGAGENISSHMTLNQSDLSFDSVTKYNSNVLHVYVVYRYSAHIN